MRNEMTEYLQLCYNAAVSIEQRYPGEQFSGRPRGECARYWLELVWAEWRKTRWAEACRPELEIKAELGGSRE